MSTKPILKVDKKISSDTVLCDAQLTHLTPWGGGPPPCSTSVMNDVRIASLWECFTFNLIICDAFHHEISFQ